MRIKNKSKQISNYQDLYDFVKNIRDEYNIDIDTVELIDMLIFKWFSQQRVRGLDSCYDLFQKKIEENEGFKIIADEMQIKAEWDN
jgi:hypothetical protein